MRRTSVFLLILLCGSFLIPLFVSAQASFGGRVVCVAPIPNTPNFWIEILSARTLDPLLPEVYIWTPATPTFPPGLPLMGQEILGLAAFVGLPALLPCTGGDFMILDGHSVL